MNEKYYIRRVNQMKTYSMDAIRNIAVMGHGKCGKTTLTRLVNALIPLMYEGDLQG
mgnify:CR=1 FL=1